MRGPHSQLVVATMALAVLAVTVRRGTPVVLATASALRAGALLDLGRRAALARAACADSKRRTTRGE